MKEIILIKNGELALKGLNRSNFEDAMIKQLRRRLKPLGEVEIKKAQSTVFVQPADEHFDFDEALRRVSMIFGIAAFSRAAVCDKDMDDIIAKGVPYLKDALAGVQVVGGIAGNLKSGEGSAFPMLCNRFKELLCGVTKKKYLAAVRGIAGIFLLQHLDHHIVCRLVDKRNHNLLSVHFKIA